MSSTRHAAPDSPLRQERYMSSSEYEELRGISGTAVAAKARLILNARKRSLLWFIQARSLEEGGLKRAAAEIVQMFPDRVVPENVEALWSKARLSQDDRDGLLYRMDDIVPRGSDLRQRFFELAGDSTFTRWNRRRAKRLLRSFTSSSFDGDDHSEGTETIPSREHFTDACRIAAELCLPEFLTELCINPSIRLEIPEDSSEERDAEKLRITESADHSGKIDSASAPWFRDIIPALFEWQNRCAEKVRSEFVMTEIASQVFETLDMALETGRIVIIQGREGVGKTEALKAWARIHAGEARLISLSGVTNKTTFFRDISKALGLASSYTQKMMDMQARVEDVLQRSKLLLLIDESQYLFSQGKRVYNQPELVNWIYTSLTNAGVGCALVTTDQFNERMRASQDQVAWNAGQFIRRVRKFTKLPDRPRMEDLDSVIRKQWPSLPSAARKLLVGHAAASPRPFPFLADTIDDAGRIARKAGREEITFADVETAVNELRLPSDEAMKQAFDPAASKRPRKARFGSTASTVQPSFSEPSEPPNAPRRRTHFDEIDSSSEDSRATSLDELLSK
jgi:DNA transposition AAA+ family ATPase